MTDKEQIIIDGVDVSRCSYYNPLGNYNCGGTKKCSQWSNCYFKQLSRKTAECEKLKEKWSIGFQKFCDKDNELQHYKQALDVIEKYLLKQCEIHKSSIGDFAIKNMCKQCEIKKNLEIITKAKDGK